MSMMLSSCTLLSMAPPQSASGKFSPAALQLRTKQPAASSLAIALPRAATYKVGRAPRLVCHALAYDIPPNALLVHPSVGDDNTWKIDAKHKDHITLEFKVGDKTNENNLEVTTTKDQALNFWLVIKYKGDGSDGSLATSLDARLLMPPGYDGKKGMKAEILPDGWLHVVIAKPKQETDTENIKVTKLNPNQSSDDR
ncbi:unnamed protein product [Urochloa decumbens]|uniref:SHSP domain-containing protein n=1 Tax=Urochloa decumbens TaxID=240449 RepID=A0ABC8VIH3_9POAL